jgi:hypothetical protein
MSAATLRRFVFAFALLNATLYACFLPLWEGFDEPFHYGYVQSLSGGKVPLFGHTKLSEEVNTSFRDVPLSRFLSGSTGGFSFEQWFELPSQERRDLRSQNIDPALRFKSSNFDNYEAQQAPLAYALLVPFDLGMSRIQLRWRILALRLFGTVAAVLLLWFGVIRFCRLLGIAGTFALAAAACVFSSQMLWATVAHVGNDYLAVPLTLLFLLYVGLTLAAANRRNPVILSVIFAAGLLTKAYFLALAPIFVALLLWRKQWLSLFIPAALAGPWYVHNKLLYGSYTGTQQAVAGIGLREAIAAIPHIPWFDSTLAFLHWSLWTGNWSFLSFSKTTLNVELILMGIGLALYFRNCRRLSAPELWVLASCACFIAGLIYQTCVTYIHTHGASLFAEPWYWQGIVCFIWVITFAGIARSGKFGRVLAVVMLALCAWVSVSTYVAKLFPVYGSGFQRSTLSRVWSWWTTHPTQDLATVTLAQPVVLYVLLGSLLLVLVAQAAALVRRIIAPE